jgi:hypothetical protein
MCKFYNIYELVSWCIIYRNCRRKPCGLASEYSVKPVVSNDEAVFRVYVILDEWRSYLWNLQQAQELSIFSAENLTALISRIGCLVLGFSFF